MSENNLPLQTNNNLISVDQLLVKFIIILLANGLLAWGLTVTLWQQNIAITHTALELVCIMISMSIFLITWQTNRFNLPLSQIFGLGFLTIAVFDILHTYFYTPLNLFPHSCEDVTSRYWIMGRLVEAGITFFLSYKLYRTRINRWVGLAVTLGVAFIISEVLFHDTHLIPVLVKDGQVTPAKVVMEYLIILIYLVSLYNLRHDINDRGVITYKYIFLALLLAIAAEFNFTLYKSWSSFNTAFGHCLKISCYIFFWKGIFASAITYPFEEMEKSNKYINNILNEIPSAITFYDQSYHLTFANKRALDMFDCQLSDITGMHIMNVREQIIQPQNSNQLPIINKIIETGDPIRNQVISYVTHTDRYYKLKIDAFRLDNGEYMYTFKEAKTEQMLENLQLQTETILNAVTNQIVIWDINNKVLMCNNAFAASIKMPREDIIGLDWNSFLAKVQFNEPTLHEDVLKSTSKGVNREITMMTSQGKSKDFILHAAAIYNVDRELIGYIDVFSEITDLKREQEKLIQQEKLALIGQLGASVVHECKNFLATIKGNSQLLHLAAKNDEKIQRYAERIDNATEEMNRIIGDLLTLAKPRKPVNEQVSLRNVVLSMENILRSSTFLVGIEVEIAPGEDQLVICDENQIRQVILNMCKNAGEAMLGVTNPVLRITTGLNESKNEVYVKIIDNGRGIPDHVLARIGTPFFTTKDTGTGLGMSICFKIIKENNGKIEIETEVDKGTTFTISFPSAVENGLEKVLTAAGS